MSEASTQYDVALRYVFKDGGAKRGVEGLSHSLDGLHKQGLGLSSLFTHIGVAVAGAFGAHAGYHALVGFNAEMQDMKITMTALTQANLNEPFELARTQMDAMVDDFTRFAKQSPLTTKEIVEFAQNVEAGVFSANGSLDDFRIIAEQGALAAKMLGADANYAGVEIQELLMGAVRKNMRFARNLLGFAGEKDTEAFNAKSDLERLEIVKKALTSPAMRQAGMQFQESFTGVTSTLKDQLQLVFGGIGLPLFKSLTEEVKKWSMWLDKNPDKIRQFAADFQSALQSGFEAMKSIAGFIVEHKDLLMMLAKAWLASKAVGVVSGSIAGLAQTLGSLAGTGAGSFGALGLSITGVVAALSAFAGLSMFTASVVDSVQDEKIAASTDWEVLMRGRREYREGRSGVFDAGSREERVAGSEGQGAAAKLLADRMIQEAKDAGFLIRRSDQKGWWQNTGAVTARGIMGGQSDKAIQDYINSLNAALGEESRYLRGLTDEQRQAQFGATFDAVRTAFVGAADVWAKTTVRAWGSEFDAGFGNKLAMVIANGYRLLPGMGPGSSTADLLKKPVNDHAKTNVNVNITRIEVQSDDPDRLVFGLAEIGRRAAKNPGRAFNPQREG